MTEREVALPVTVLRKQLSRLYTGHQTFPGLSVAGSLFAGPRLLASTSERSFEYVSERRKTENREMAARATM
jgi:hypothetical protein